MSALPQIEVPAVHAGASPVYGIDPLPPPPTTPPVPVGAGKTVMLGLPSGNPIGLFDGVMVVFPITISGALAEIKDGAEVIVDDPLKVAVNVVNTSSIVVVLSGSLVAGLVVAARVVRTPDNATVGNNMVVVDVRFVTCASIVPPTLAPPPWQVEKPMYEMNARSPARSRVTWPLPVGSVSVNAVGSSLTYEVVVQTPFTCCWEVSV